MIQLQKYTIQQPTHRTSLPEEHNILSVAYEMNQLCVYVWVDADYYGTTPVKTVPVTFHTVSVNQKLDDLGDLIFLGTVLMVHSTPGYTFPAYPILPPGMPLPAMTLPVLPVLQSIAHVFYRYEKT